MTIYKQEYVIDVASVAHSAGIPHEEASKIIQEWAFQLGYSWYNAVTTPQFTNQPYIFLEPSGSLTHSGSFKYVTEFILAGDATFLSIALKSKGWDVVGNVPTIKLNGQDFTKEELLEALAKFD